MAPKKDRAAPSISAKRSMKYRVLRVNKPVQTQLSMDVWDRIFANSRPEVLFKLRLVCAGFRDALSPDVSLWKESLDLEFGSAVPSPPRGLSWLNYAILLTVRCCQACGTKDNTKIFWAFERRYCKSCLERKTVLHSELVYDLEERQLYPDVDELLHSLPRATFGLSRQYLFAGGEYDDGLSATLCQSGFLRSDVPPLQAEFEIVATTDTIDTEAETRTFWEKKIRENNDRITQLEEIETFVKTHEQGKSYARAVNREAKKDFYNAKALALDPPIETKILEGCKSYKLATRSPRLLADCERTWPVLLAKLRKEEVGVRAEYAAKEREDAMACARALSCDF